MLTGGAAALLIGGGIWLFYDAVQQQQQRAAACCSRSSQGRMAHADLARSTVVQSLPVVASASPVCAFAPALRASGPRDGRFEIAPALAMRPPGNAAAFTAAAREATREGRPRDAEVALLVACRLAARKSGPATVPTADAQALLGSYYALSSVRALPDEREEIRARATRLLERSHATYAAALGRQASKTRLAAERLAALDAVGRLTTAGLAQQDTDTDGDEIASVSHAVDVLPDSSVEDLLRADSDLAQLDSDLARLRAQAGSVTSDQDGFRRRVEAAGASKAACRTRDCLMRWYAKRRTELVREF